MAQNSGKIDTLNRLSQPQRIALVNRRESQIFIVTDFTESDTDDDNATNNSIEARANKQQQQQQQNPGKITKRRQSQRLLGKRKENEREITDTQPQPPKKRGRPQKASTSAQTNANVNAGAIDSPSLSVSDENPDFNSDVKTKTVLSEAIFGLFEDIKQEKGKRYSAKCTLCHQNESRNFFQKGINSNLKGHLERVSFFCIFFFFFMYKLYSVLC